jgi:glycosyltransferase involved in cell wall biosynthesis
MRLGLLVPIWQRPELAAFTLRQNLDAAVAAGHDVTPIAVISPDDPDALDVVENAGWEHVVADNSPLSQKWNAGMDAFRDKGVDAVMILGSDDLIHRTVFEAVESDLAANENVDWWGVMDCFVLHGASNRIAHYKGYPEESPRHGEPIGTCRTFRASMLAELDWKPWGGDVESGCDSAMQLSEYTSGLTFMGKTGPILDIKAYPLIDLGSFWDMADGKVLTSEQTDVAVEQIFDGRVAMQLQGICNPLARAVKAFEPDVHGPFLSVCLMVKNEEAGISEALASLVGWADEVCVLDTGSTDNTAEICEAWGCRVERREYEQPFDFAEGRNDSIRMGRGQWIMLLDGDEWVVGGETFRESLEDLPDGVNVVGVPHVIMGVGSTTDTTNTLMRFLKGVDVANRKLKYVYPAHHQLLGIEKFAVFNEAHTREPEFDPTVSAKRAIRTLSKRLMLTSAPGGTVLGPDSKPLGGHNKERAHCLLYLARMTCIVASAMEDPEKRAAKFQSAAAFAGKLIDEGTHLPQGYLILLHATEQGWDFQTCIPMIGKALQRFPQLVDLYWWEMRACASVIAILTSQPSAHPLVAQHYRGYMGHLADCSKFLGMNFYQKHHGGPGLPQQPTPEQPE